MNSEIQWGFHSGVFKHVEYFSIYLVKNVYKSMSLSSQYCKE